MKLGVQCCEELAFHLNVSVCVSESQHHALWNSTWHLSRPGNGCSLFSNSPAPSGRPCSFSHCRETADHRVSFLLHFYSLLSYFLCTLTSLFHSPSLLSNFLAFRSLLHSVAFRLFLFSALSLSLLSLRSASPPSSQLSCSGIVPDHSTSKYLLLTVALCSPHLDHVILKSEGTTLQISMSACLRQRGKKRQRAGEGESYVTHSQASEINALWLNLPFSHLLLFRKSKPCCTTVLKLHINATDL